ncbi:MAG TPA: 1-acyl-sn-glycerol-3-phosphate acyltransferase [Longimicrobiales bacterium]|nr:1-acyl-sn-glycerol-3-phosphate acyltransferase [Longimicrobiales bacterium]
MSWQAVAASGFDLVFAQWRRRRLRTAPVLGLPASLPRDRPLVLVANHTSWWDGFLLRDLYRVLRPGAPLHVVMLAEELQRHPFLGVLGGVPMKPDSPASVLGTLRRLHAEVERRPEAGILYFPQGRIWPAWRRPLGFHRGIELLLRQLGPALVLPAAIHVEALNRSAPTAFISLAPVRESPGDDVSARALEAAVEDRLDHLAGLLAEHGEALPGNLELHA